MVGTKGVVTGADASLILPMFDDAGIVFVVTTILIESLARLMPETIPSGPALHLSVPTLDIRPKFEAIHDWDHQMSRPMNQTNSMI
ncbi:MAG: hypothetical protein MN733_31970 [Nitrososphaera sp.]|nr:hypothetical protein [Nitrososphaera sp.]